MASFFDTHITFSAPSDWLADSTVAVGAAAIVMSGRSTAPVGRLRGDLNAGEVEALSVRCART